MKTTDIQSADGTALRLRSWGEGGRRVLIVHGLGEHGGRYAHVAEALARRGYGVTALDLRGHGGSGGKRGHVDGWGDYVADVRAAAAHLGGTLSLFAHSMGGLVVADAVESGMPVPLRGVAMSNPLVALRVVPPALKVRAARVLSRVLPRLSLGNEVNPAHVSRDAEVVRRYEADPQVFGTITPRWATEMERARARVLERAAQFQAPLLMMVSEGDKIVDPAGGRALAQGVAGPARVLEYGPLYHELVNEPEQAQVIADLGDWFDTLGDA
jgi:alpha-beta hydrolase superfamily lysophospholipase